MLRRLTHPTPLFFKQYSGLLPARGECRSAADESPSLTSVKRYRMQNSDFPCRDMRGWCKVGKDDVSSRWCRDAVDDERTAAESSVLRVRDTLATINRGKKEMSD